MRRFIFILALIWLAVGSQAQMPKHEVRAVWLATIGGIDWPRSSNSGTQQQELIHTLDMLQAANINTVLIQARVRATTIYPSTLEPWDGCITGVPGKAPVYDPLQFAIEECHKRGMECHAWVVTIPIGKWSGLGCRRFRERYPRLAVKIGDEGYMNPEMGETGDYLARVCRDIARRYDVDGIHLDYIRYPETWRLRVSRQQGRQYITSIVRKISHAVKAEKPWVKLSCSPIGKYDDLAKYRSLGWNANTTVCQDAQGWMREGLMDALFPMMYFQGNNFYPFAVNWKEHAYGRIVTPGLAAYMLHPRENNWPLSVIRREMEVIRSLGMGHTFFRSKFLTDNIKGIYTFTKDFNAAPALIPPMTWVHKQAPSAPSHIEVTRGMRSDVVRWQSGRDNAAGDYLLYNIYASESYPVDISDARNLISVRQRELTVTVPHGGNVLNYAITATDRYGNESAPAASNQMGGPTRRVIDFRELIMHNPGKRNKHSNK